MKTVAEIRVQPIGKGVSSREEVQQAVAVLRDLGFETHTHALGTEIEGEMSAVFTAVQRIHERLHQSGTPRLVTNVVIQTHADQPPDIQHAVESIEGPLIETPH